jgi:hypothetical protein
LNWYHQHMVDEALLFQRVRQTHLNHRRELLTEFESHELQLQKWAQGHVLPSFRLQAWMRLSRSKLLEDMSTLAIRKFERRAEKGEKVIQHFTNNRSGKGFLPLDTYNDFSSVVSAELSLLNKILTIS